MGYTIAERMRFRSSCSFVKLTLKSSNIWSRLPEASPALIRFTKTGEKNLGYLIKVA